jgi:tetratricopeptide (TPR) repeat protein
MVKKRLTRKELLKEPDEFFTLTGQLINWVKANPKPITYGGGVLLAVIAIILGYGYYQKNRASVAADLLGKSLAQYGQLVANGGEAKALATVGPDFERLIDKLGGQPAGRLGCLLYAHFNLKAGEFRKAAELYQKALRSFAREPSLAPIILNGLASAYQAAGDTSLAIGTYEKIVALDVKTYTDSALFELGGLYAKAGQTEKSREMYERLTANFPDSSYVPLAREKMAG